jgi:hypothetical protein
VARIPAWKFDAVRAAILDELAGGDVAFADLPGRVAARLPHDVKAKLGSVGWHTTTVKLELEVRGEVVRMPGVTPQKLRLGMTR